MRWQITLSHDNIDVKYSSIVHMYFLSTVGVVYTQNVLFLHLKKCGLNVTLQLDLPPPILTRNAMYFFQKLDNYWSMKASLSFILKVSEVYDVK